MKIATVALIFLLVGPNQHTFATQSNVLIVITDDQGWGDLSLHGNQNLQTPNMDALAREGARFENFYVCPICSPTRCELLTGRYHRRCGVTGVSEGSERINLDERTLGDVFVSAGYRTGLIGKWHNGTQHPYHPNDRGFQEFYGFTSGHWGSYFSPRLDHNGSDVRGNGYLSDDFTDHAIEFASANDPFLLVLAYNTPHSPMQVPQEWWSQYADLHVKSKATDSVREQVEFTRAALAMVANMDWNIGRLFESLKSQGKLDNTIIMFMSDNGPNSHRFNGEMVGIKGSVDEGGVRSPLFVRFPSQIAAGTKIDQLTGAVDILPTLIEFCKTDHAAKKVGINSQGKSLDGFSIANYLRNEVQDEKSRALWSAWRSAESLRIGPMLFKSDGTAFDVRTDREQKQNIAPTQTEQLSASTVEMQKLNTDSARLSQTIRPFTIGYHLGLLDQLPARDATLLGGVRHSSIHPNCSYVTDWTSTQQQIIWTVEAMSSGVYEVTIDYTCPAESGGGKIQFSSDRTDSKPLEFQFAESFDPPRQGADVDRVPRIESYWKEMTLQTIGRVTLPVGPQRLTLQAVSISGPTVGEVGRICVTRVK